MAGRKSHAHGKPSIRVHDVTKTFSHRKALDSLSIEIAEGEMVALIGPSGAGKSTLLRCLAGLEVADSESGAILVGNEIIQDAGRLKSHVRRLRATIGFVFQQFNLVGRLSLLTNVLVGCLARVPHYRRLFRWFTKEEKLEAIRALQKVGLADFVSQRADTLSGGQQQRAAIARAMVQGAKVVLADEPIASLDPESARTVMESLRLLNQSEGITVVVSLHQMDHARRYCDRLVGLREGSICCDCAAEDITELQVKHLYKREAA